MDFMQKKSREVYMNTDREYKFKKALEELGEGGNKIYQKEYKSCIRDGLTEESAVKNAQNAVVTEWYWIMA